MPAHRTQVREFTEVLLRKLQSPSKAAGLPGPAQREPHELFARVIIDHHLSEEDSDLARAIRKMATDKGYPPDCVAEFLVQEFASMMTRPYQPGHDVEEYEIFAGDREQFGHDTLAAMTAREWAMRTGGGEEGLAHLAVYADFIRNRFGPQEWEGQLHTVFLEEVAASLASPQLRVGGKMSPLSHPTSTADPQEETPLSHTRMIGGYQLLAQLGRGGMGEVFRAVGPDGTEVAVKTARDTAGGHRLRHEAEMLSRLSHPGIVIFIDSDSDAEPPHFAMRLVHGQSLTRAWQARREEFTPKRIAGIAEEIARALQYAHERGIVHRDVKPSNIMLTSEGAVLIDFGAAYVGSSFGADPSPPPETRAVPGTLVYLAPELLQGATHDPRADVYSLGVVLHALIEGVLPFTHEDEAALQDRIITDDVWHLLATGTIGNIFAKRFKRNPAELGVNDLKLICLKCLRKDPLQRYRTACELADDLARFVRSEPMRATILFEPMFTLDEYRHVTRELGCPVRGDEDQSACDDLLRDAAREHWFYLDQWFEAGLKKVKASMDWKWGKDRSFRLELARMWEEERPSEEKLWKQAIYKAMMGLFPDFDEEGAENF